MADEITLASRIRAVCAVFGVTADELEQIGTSLVQNDSTADTLSEAPCAEAG